jgi:hypothetical protein
MIWLPLTLVMTLALLQPIRERSSACSGRSTCTLDPRAKTRCHA